MQKILIKVRSILEQIAIIHNDRIVDLVSADANVGTAINFNNSPQALEVIRHSAAHLLAQAIKKLYPEAQFFVGPVVKEGFYYDFKVDIPIGEDDLKTIEKEMKKLAKKKISYY